MMVNYFVDDKLGGVTSLNYNLITNCPKRSVKQCVILIRQIESNMARANVIYPNAENELFSYTTKDNYYTTLKLLSKVIDRTAEGVLVLNYETEMAMLDHYPAKQTTYQLIHDDYNVNLALKYNHIVDVFICHNTIIYEKMINLFPDRVEHIFYKPHGVPIPDKFRSSIGNGSVTPIKLLFIGRMVESKGIFDLPVINNLLRGKHISFEWTCIGSGPDLEKLKQVWNPLDKVVFLSPQKNEEVLEIAATQDVFVLPTKFEGSPVSLLEAMSVGLVPVVSKIPGGITDTITEKIGFIVEVDDNEGFANAIDQLCNNSRLLDKLSLNAREKIIAEFDVRKTAKTYYDLFASHKEFYRDKRLKKIKVGARLDHPFLPSAITKFVRTLRERNG